MPHLKGATFPLLPGQETLYFGFRKASVRPTVNTASQKPISSIIENQRAMSFKRRPRPILAGLFQLIRAAIKASSAMMMPKLKRSSQSMFKSSVI
jgi:hypothetical protein